jgi:cytochrome c
VKKNAIAMLGALAVFSSAYAVVGRAAGTSPGYRYSSAMRKSGLTWDDATLREYLRGPEKVVPGTKMAFPGIASDEEIANVIAYLKQQKAE